LDAPRPEPGAPGPTLALVAGTSIAAAALLLAGLAGGPYLDLSSLNPWLAVFAVAAFAALIAVPFAVERLLTAAHPERAEHWERAMLIWGGVAAAALLVGVGLIAAGGFSPGASLADAVGLLLLIDAGMVVATLVVWVLSD
jgi:uncharacterized membrane protein YedE/YeeE